MQVSGSRICRGQSAQRGVGLDIFRRLLHRSARAQTFHQDVEDLLAAPMGPVLEPRLGGSYGIGCLAAELELRDRATNPGLRCLMPR